MAEAEQQVGGKGDGGGGRLQGLCEDFVFTLLDGSPWRILNSGEACLCFM